MAFSIPEMDASWSRTSMAVDYGDSCGRVTSQTLAIGWVSRRAVLAAVRYQSQRATESGQCHGETYQPAAYLRASGSHGYRRLKGFQQSSTECHVEDFTRNRHPLERELRWPDGCAKAGHLTSRHPATL
jgi:hypothetical protein